MRIEIMAATFVDENRARSKAAALVAVAAALALGAPPVRADDAPERAAKSEAPDAEAYAKAKARAWRWIAALEVDAAELVRHGVKGKKKVGEILAVCLAYHRHATTDAERAAVIAKVAEVEKQTLAPAYHDLHAVSDRVFTENSMSYFRVLWLLEQFGRDTSFYRSQIARVKPRMDAHLARRGPWQRAMFAEYYDRFGLEKPPILTAPAHKTPGVIERRLAAERYDRNAAYNLTHEVFVAFDYGLRREQTTLTVWDLDYCAKTFPVLVRRFVEADDADIAAELALSMVYLGLGDDPACRAALRWLLDVQNADGSWGKYERFRARYGRHLDHHAYLHTTMVAVGALMAAYEGGWPRQSLVPTASP